MARSQSEGLLASELDRRAIRRELQKAGVYRLEFNRRFGPQGYEVDIVLPDLMVVVEVDGPHHCLKCVSIRDREKERYLESEGYTVYRVTAEEVRNSPRAVARKIVQLARSHQPVHRLSWPPRLASDPQLGEQLRWLRAKLPA